MLKILSFCRNRSVWVSRDNCILQRGILFRTVTLLSVKTIKYTFENFGSDAGFLLMGSEVLHLTKAPRLTEIILV